MLSPWIQREVAQSKRGSASNPIPMPKQVHRRAASRVRPATGSLPILAPALQVATLDVLDLLLDYCQFHHATGRSDKARLQQS